MLGMCWMSGTCVQAFLRRRISTPSEWQLTVKPTALTLLRHLDLKSAVWWDKALSIGNELVGIASGQPEVDWPTSRLGVDDNVTLHVSGRGKSRISEIGTIDLSKQPTGLEGYEKRVEGNLPTISGGSGSNAQFSE